MLVAPGLPVTIDSALGAEEGVYTFFHYYNPSQISYWGPNTYPFFDVTLSSGSLGVTLSNSVVSKAPDPPQTAPWWDFLKASIEVMEGMFGAVTGDWAETARASLDLLWGTADIINGVTDGSGNKNINQKSLHVLSTQMTAPIGKTSLASMNGGICGGDSYTVSDGGNFVFALTTVKSNLMPPTVQLTITPYAEYLGQQALGNLSGYRQGNGPDNTKCTTAPCACILALAFEQWDDLQDSKPCSFPSAYPSYDYMVKASSLTNSWDWWGFTNNLMSDANDPVQLATWMKAFGASCGKLPPGCPSPAPMTASPTSFNGVTDSSPCSFAINVIGAGSSVRGLLLPTGWSENTGSCGDPQPPASCSYTLVVPAGASGTVNITDGYTPIPIKASCAARQMVVQQLTYSGSSYPSPCHFSVPVSGPRSAVSATPATYVTGNTCTQATDSSCTLSLDVPSGTTGHVVKLTDGITTAQITASCNDVPMNLPGYYAGFSGNTPFSSCSLPVTVNQPHGKVSVDPPGYLGPSGCTGPATSCQLNLVVPVNTVNKNVSFSDGSSTVTGVQVGCSVCTTMVLPQSTYHVTPGIEAKLSIDVQCAQSPVTAVASASDIEVDTTDCSSKMNCTVTATTKGLGSIILTDSKGTQVKVTIAKSDPL